MKMTRTWFTLTRHDGNPADPAPDSPPATDPPEPTEPPATDPPADSTDWKAEAAKWKALSRKNEDQAKANATAARKLADIEAANQTEAEKLAAKADAAEKRAADALARTAQAEIRALAEGFADRDDAVLMLGDLTQYIRDGDVDTAAIQERLDDVLTRKPHLAKAAPAGPVVKQPAPDPSQGRGGDIKPPDFRTASDEDVARELAKYGVRTRR